MRSSSRTSSQDHLDLHGTMEEYFAGEAAALHRPAAAAGRRQRRGRVGTPARLRPRGPAPGSARDVRVLRRGRGASGAISCSTRTAVAFARQGSESRRDCAVGSTSRTSSAPWRPGSAPRSRRGRDRRGDRERRGRSRQVRGDRRGTVVRGRRRLRAHARLARDGARGRARARRRDGSSSCSAQVATAIAARGHSWGGSPRSWPT